MMPPYFARAQKRPKAERMPFPKDKPLRDRKVLWLPIVWTAGLYEVSDAGDVRSLSRARSSYGGRRYIQRGRVLRQSTNRDGYRLATLCLPGERHYRQVHRLVYEAFVGPLEIGMDVAHRDGDRANNRRANLVQCSRAENIQHQVAHGTRIRGAAKPASKLTDAKVKEIRARHATGESYRRLAGAFNVSSHTVGVIVRRETWTHVA